MSSTGVDFAALGSVGRTLLCRDGPWLWPSQLPLLAASVSKHCVHDSCCSALHEQLPLLWSAPCIGPSQLCVLGNKSSVPLLQACLLAWRSLQSAYLLMWRLNASAALHAQVAASQPAPATLDVVEGLK